MATPSRKDKAEALARDIRQLLTLVGIPEWVPGTDCRAGGYYLSTFGDRVKLSWTTDAGINTASGELWLDHPDHPLARLERGVTTAMERALADVLYAAGFTVALVPGVPNRVDLDKDRDPELIVLDGPEFKAWSSG